MEYPLCPKEESGIGDRTVRCSGSLMPLWYQHASALDGDLFSGFATWVCNICEYHVVATTIAVGPFSRSIL
jgi:hypothetical protein